MIFVIIQNKAKSNTFIHKIITNCMKNSYLFPDNKSLDRVIVYMICGLRSCYTNI